MKTRCLLIGFLLFSTTLSFSQTSFGISVSGGSCNINNPRLYFNRFDPLKTTDVVHYLFESTYSWNAGFYVNIPLKVNGLSTGAEILINNLGAFLPQSDMEINEEIIYQQAYRERMVYFSLPVFLKYNVSGCWYIKGGVTAGILLYIPESNYSQPKKFDFGGNLAFGLNLFPKLDLEMNAYHSLIRINQSASWEEGSDNRLFNSSITVSLKYELWKRE
jgi:hypothetical protein